MEMRDINFKIVLDDRGEDESADDWLARMRESNLNDAIEKMRFEESMKGSDDMPDDVLVGVATNIIDMVMKQVATHLEAQGEL